MWPIILNITEILTINDFFEGFFGEDFMANVRLYFRSSLSFSLYFFKKRFNVFKILKCYLYVMLSNLIMLNL